MNVCARVKNEMIGVLGKKFTCRILVHLPVSVIKYAKLVSI